MKETERRWIVPRWIVRCNDLGISTSPFVNRHDLFFWWKIDMITVYVGKSRTTIIAVSGSNTPVTLPRFLIMEGESKRKKKRGRER